MCGKAVNFSGIFAFFSGKIAFLGFRDLFSIAIDFQVETD
jgi:hypothetical protein